MTRYFRCHNPGSCGRFRFVTRTDRPAVKDIGTFDPDYWGLAAPTSFKVGDFTLTPAAFAMGVDGDAEIKVEFTPSAAGPVREHVRVVVDDCSVREMTLEALSEEPQLAFAGNTAVATAQYGDSSTLTSLIFEPAQPGYAQVSTIPPGSKFLSR